MLNSLDQRKTVTVLIQLCRTKVNQTYIKALKQHQLGDFSSESKPVLVKRRRNPTLW